MSSLYGSVSPIADNHAGNRAFNKTTVQIDSTAEQDKNIFRSGIKSGKRRQSVVNSGLKIKLKAHHRSSNGPEDNPSNNINLFTQEGDIKPEIRKKNYNTGD